MPIYDYHCDHCGHTFSAVQSYTDATLDKCPSCGKRPRKLMAMPAIVFKGGGWYKTDSRPAQKDAAETKPSDGSKDVFVHISAVERAGMSTLNEGQRLTYEIVTERGKQAASNLQNA